MAKKNILSQIKALDKSGKTKNQVKAKDQEISPSDNLWEAWQCHYIDGRSQDWKQLWEGSLDECFAVLQEHMYCQIQIPMLEDGTIEDLCAKYDHEPEGVSQMLEKLSQPKIDEFRFQCLQNKHCEGEGWAIRAVQTQEPVKGTVRTVKNQYLFAYSPDWEAGALFTEEPDWEEEEELPKLELQVEEYDDGLGDGEEDEDEENWQYIADGSLSECLEAIMFYVTMELDKEFDKQMSDDMDMGKFFKEQTKRRTQKLEEIKKACLVNGEYQGDGWHIRSQRTREQCQWLAANGYPVVN